MKTVIKNLGPQRSISFLPHEQPKLVTNETLPVHGDLETILSITGRIPAIIKIETEELLGSLEVVHDFQKQAFGPRAIAY